MLSQFTAFLVIALLPFSAIGQSEATAKKALMLMGCSFELAASAENDTIAWKAINAGIAEITRIERLISSWDPKSQTSEVNRMAGIKAVHVDKELYDLIYRAKKVSKLTGGAFDISFASMDKIWFFDQLEQELAPSEQVEKAKSHISFEEIMLNPQDTSVYLSEGMKIGFGAIGKGYAANKAKQIMKNIPGVQGGVVNASGDILCWGENPTSEGWRIHIANPHDQEKPIAWMQAKDLAVVTSGDYEKYFTSHGKRYAHIIDPRTGYPASGITSVTIICPDAELADALATSIFVLGKEAGIALINKLKQVECIIITDDGKMYQSDELKLNYY